MKWFRKAFCVMLMIIVLSVGSLCEASAPQGYSVYLPEGLIGLSLAAMPGGDYAFVIVEGNQDRYHYSISATMNGVPVELEDKGYGIYMIRNVSGNIHVTMTRQVKICSVTVVGSGADLVTCDDTAVYGEIFRFYADPEKVVISVTVDGVPCRAGSGEGGKYILLAPEVKGDIVITAKKIGQMFGVTFTGSGAADAVGNAQVKEGESCRFTVNRVPGFDYRITATMGGASVQVAAEGTNGYLISGVTGPLVITAEKTRQATVKPQQPKPPAETDTGNSATTKPAPEPETPVVQPPEEPKPPETTVQKEPQKVPPLPDVVIGTFEEEEAREPFPWWIVVAGTVTVLSLAALALLMGRKRVVFVTDCDTVVRTQRVLKGKLAIRPAEPHKDGAVFAGWFVDEAGTKRWIFEENRVEDHMILYAKWI